MVELAARLGYECEGGDPEQLVVMPGGRPTAGAVPIVMRLEPTEHRDRVPVTGRVEIARGLAGSEYGLLLTAPDSRWLWKLAAFLAATGLHDTQAASAMGQGTNCDYQAGDLSPVGNVSRMLPGWNADVRYDSDGRVAEVALDGISAEPGHIPHSRAGTSEIGEVGEEDVVGLDDLWSPRGLLGSSDGLHPDRVSVAIEPAWGQTTWAVDELAGLIMFAFRLGLEATGLEFPLTANIGNDRPYQVCLIDSHSSGPGGATIQFRRASSGQTGGILIVSGDAAGRGEALRWLATAHASERLRPVGTRRPALDSAAAVMEREQWLRVVRAVSRESADLLLQYSLPPEAERFRRLWRERVLPVIQAECHWDDELWVDIRLDQPDEVLEELAAEVRRTLVSLGFRPERIRLRSLPAFRQGVHWLLQAVPEAVQRHTEVHTITVEFAQIGSGAGSVTNVPGEGPCLDPRIRWLEALYPVDELLSVQTGLPPERIVFRAMQGNDLAAPTYRVYLHDSVGRELWRDEFRVAARIRPYQNAHPHLGWVHVETGVCRVERAVDTPDGRVREVVFHELIASGAESFWDWYQGDVLPRLARVLEERLGTELVAEHQPFFLTLDVQLEVDTRPDEHLGVREEFYSTAEGLHEDVYFNTLDFFHEWGIRRGGTAFSAPGKIVPRIRACPGRGTRAMIRLTGVGIGRRLAMSDNSRPYGRTVETRQIIVAPSGRARALLHVAGRGTVEVEYDEAIRRTRWAPGFNQVLLTSSGTDADTWRRTIFDAESLGRYLVSLSARRPLRWTVAGYSFEGRPVYHLFPVATGPDGARVTPDTVLVPAKATLFRPTVLFKARHHANEVSSTNALLALFEEFFEATDGLNCIVIPLENADGAALHLRLHRESQKWSLHCARYNALGQEYALEYFGSKRRLAPETQAYPYLWHCWLPDVVVDEHGVPSHEWVQPFGGHGGGRRFASYWIPRALIYGILPCFDSDDLADHVRLQQDFAEFISEELKRWNEVAEANRRWLSIYRKYAAAWLPDVFEVETVGDFVCYRWRIAPDADGRYVMQRHPEITGIEFITEAADETAVDAYLECCAEAHLAVDLAVLAWVRRQPLVVEETVEERAGVVYRRRFRRRPWRAGAGGGPTRTDTVPLR